MPTPSREAADAAITSMLRERGFDGIVRSLMGTTRAPQQMAEDAVMHAVAQTLKRADDHEVTNVATYVFVSARNELFRILKAEGRFRTIDEQDGDPDSEPELTEAEANDLLRWIKTLIKDWNENIRIATSLALDHAFLDEWQDLTMDDFASELEDILGVEVSAKTAAMWKHRGLTRLRNQMNGIETDNENTEDERSKS